MSSFAQNPTLRRLRAALYRSTHHTRISRSGENHRIDLSDALLHRCNLQFSGENLTVSFGQNVRLWDVTLRLIGSHHTLHIGDGVRLRGGNILLEDQHCSLHIGARTEAFCPSIIVSEKGNIRIGSDCLLAAGLILRNSDGHSILDQATGQRINPAADITIEDHVWIGTDCTVLKGAILGHDSIIAARSVVTKPTAAHTISVGTPARAIKDSVTWDHRRL